MDYKLYTINGIKEVVENTIELPTPTGVQVVVKVDSTAICTLEQRIYAGVRKMYPFAGGHEVAGTVYSIGDQVTQLKPGDKVALRLLNSCRECHYCRKGLGHLCQVSYKASTHKGHMGPGGFSEYMLVDSFQAFKVADDLDLAHACLAEPLACCVHSINRADIQLAETVVVIGVGFMGALHIQLAKMRGARVIACEIDENRLEVAKKMGADILINSAQENAVEKVKELTDGHGADVVFCLNAITALAEESVNMLGKRGRAIMYSSFHPKGMISIDPDKIHSDETVITGSVNPDVPDFYTATQLLSHQTLDIESLISARYPMTQLTDALEQAITPGTYRVIVQNR